MPSFKTLTLSFIIALATAQNHDTPAFQWDCTNSIDLCNNYCYAENLTPSDFTLTYDNSTANAKKRNTQSGCPRQPCQNRKLKYGKLGPSCNSFPFTSTTSGGTGAILRCTAKSETTDTQNQLNAFYAGTLGGQNADFNVYISNYGGAPYCLDSTANDGYEFTFKSGKFVNAKRGEGFEDAAPIDAAVRVARREFELSDGTRVMRLGNVERDLIGDYVGAKRIVREI